MGGPAAAYAGLRGIGGATATLLTGLAVAVLAILGSGCGDERATELPPDPPPAASAEPLPMAPKPRALPVDPPEREDAPEGPVPLDRAETLGAFLAEHWRLPVPAQGPAPEGWSEAESSLDPVTCGACHPKQFSEWRTSLHAGAWSPGFYGQLIEGSLADERNRHACQTCHTPLAEQLLADGFGGGDAALRAQGLVCAGCHVRAHQRFGPPRREGLPPVPEPVPHGGFEVRSEWQESRFCAECHQFWNDPGINGKPVQNTFVEWQQSPQAKAGRTCQSCHMPDRAHRWRGIHDPDTVRAAVDAELVLASAGGRIEASLVLTNRDVGHAFPTYVTPRVFLSIHQADARGQEIPDTRMRATVGRQIDFGRGVEQFDTRVLPGESVVLDYTRERHADAVFLQGRVEVDPDHHYRGVFESLVGQYEDPRAVEAMRQALGRTRTSSYELATFRRRLPGR